MDLFSNLLILYFIVFQDDSGRLMNELRDEIARLRDKLAASNLTDGNSKEDVAQMQVSTSNEE